MIGKNVESLHHTEQLALLLSVMGPQATETALKSVDEEAAAQVRSTLESLRLDPPSKEEIEFVLDDFAKYFRFALKTVGAELEKQEKEKARPGGFGGNSRKRRACGDAKIPRSRTNGEHHQ